MAERRVAECTDTGVVSFEWRWVAGWTPAKKTPVSIRAGVLDRASRKGSTISVKARIGKSQAHKNFRTIAHADTG